MVAPFLVISPVMCVRKTSTSSTDTGGGVESGGEGSHLRKRLQTQKSLRPMASKKYGANYDDIHIIKTYNPIHERFTLRMTPLESQAYL